MRTRWFKTNNYNDIKNISGGRIWREILSASSTGFNTVTYFKIRPTPHFAHRGYPSTYVNEAIVIVIIIIVVVGMFADTFSLFYDAANTGKD